MICKEKYKTAFLTRCVEKLTSPRVYEWWYWIIFTVYNVSITNHTNLIKIRHVNPLLYETLLVFVWHIAKERLYKSSFNYTGIIQEKKTCSYIQYVRTIPVYQDVFRRFDKDKNGTISVENLEKVMRALGQEVTQDDVKAMIREYDRSG